MEEQIGVKDEITLSELFKILWRKALILTLAFVIGLIAGGVFGVLKTWNVHYYGTTVTFYVNPSRNEDTSSETESETDSELAEDDYAVTGAYKKPVMESMVELLNSEGFSELLLLDEKGMPAKGISPEIDALIDAGDTTAALEAWRKTNDYKAAISLVNKSTTYSCIENSVNTSDNLAKSFIVAEISVLNDDQQAEFLLERVKTRVPAYVSQKMIKPAGYTTNCQRITRLDDVKLLNPGNLLSTTIKYAILLGAATLLAASVAVIVVDYSDKRLRNFERTMEQLGVPVLGVIPTITEPAPKTQTDKEVA